MRFYLQRSVPIHPKTSEILRNFVVDKIQNLANFVFCLRLDQETSSEEAAAQAAFEEFSGTSGADKDAKTEELETKRKEKVAAAI